MKRSTQGFTLIEIAISLAIIGIALVGIIGVLPMGMNTQRDTREETVINEDAAMLMPIITQGAHGADDLTNYVYAIVNAGSNPVGYTNALAGQMGFSTANYPEVTSWNLFLTNGANIVGLLSTPEFVFSNTVTEQLMAVPNLNYGGVSNHIIACVRGMSGLAAEEPPQNNGIVIGDSFQYRVLCVNAPVALDTNQFSQFPAWQATTYNAGSEVICNWNIWSAARNVAAVDVPGQSGWSKVPFQPLALANSQREVRLTFYWPLLPNGKVGNEPPLTFRSTVAGSVVPSLDAGFALYYLKQGFFQSN